MLSPPLLESFLGKKKVCVEIFYTTEPKEVSSFKTLSDIRKEKKVFVVLCLMTFKIFKSLCHQLTIQTSSANFVCYVTHKALNYVSGLIYASQLNMQASFSLI